MGPELGAALLTTYAWASGVLSRSPCRTITGGQRWPKVGIPGVSSSPAVRNQSTPDTLAVRMRVDPIAGKSRNRFCLFFLPLTANSQPHPSSPPPKTPAHKSENQKNNITCKIRTSSRLMCEERVAFLHFLPLFLPQTPNFFSNLPFSFCFSEKQKMS